MAYETIIVEVEDHICVVTLNRPDALNALNDELLGELADALEDAQKNEKVRCIVLTGSEKAFAAGADISMMANKDHEKYISYFKNITSITTFDLKTQPNSISGQDLKEKFKIMSNVQYQPSIEQAIKSINLKEGDLLLITGSLYGAAEVLSLN